MASACVYLDYITVSLQRYIITVIWTTLNIFNIYNIYLYRFNIIISGCKFYGHLHQARQSLQPVRMEEYRAFMLGRFLESEKEKRLLQGSWKNAGLLDCCKGYVSPATISSLILTLTTIYTEKSTQNKPKFLVLYKGDMSVIEFVI